MKFLFGVGFQTKIQDMLFDPSKDYRACLICGAVYQSAFDRAAVGPLKAKKRLRDNWAVKHAKSHPELEHRLLKASGLSMTPTAAHKLAAFGLLPLTDMAIEIAPSLNNVAERGEVSAALLESSPMPTEDSEG